MVDANRPNILLITTDQQRFDAMRLNKPDSPLCTANMDALARGGVNFTRAYSTCPVCIPARRSLLTGLHPTTHGLMGYRDGLEWDPPFTVPQLLGRSGYQTQLIGKLHLYPQRKRYGFDHMIRSESPATRPESQLMPVNDYAEWLQKQGVVGEVENHGVNGNSRLARPHPLAESYHHTSWLTDQAIDFLTRRRDPSCPWFLHLSYWAPHPPLVPPQAYWDRYCNLDLSPSIGQWASELRGDGLGLAPDAMKGPFDPEEIRRAIAGYFGLIHHIDDRINALLERYFVYGSERAHEPTLILFTSDHGEMLGDHHLFRKSLPYEASAHVPLFLSHRNMGLATGVTNDALVGLEDVAATCLDAGGVNLPKELAGALEGKSLMPALRGDALSTRDWLFGQCEAMGGLSHVYAVHGPLKYVYFTQSHKEQLFNVIDDPSEMRDLSENTDLLESFRDAVSEYMTQTGQQKFERQALKPCCNRSPW